MLLNGSLAAHASQAADRLKRPVTDSIFFCEAIVVTLESPVTSLMQSGKSLYGWGKINCGGLTYINHLH